MSSTSSPARSTTTTTTRPEYSFDDSVPPPKLVNTGTNYVAILRSLLEYGNWTVAHRPNAALLSTFLSRGTDLFDSYNNVLTLLGSRSQRAVELVSAPNEFTLISATGGAFSMRVVEHITVHRIIGRSGSVVSEGQFSGPTTYVDLAVQLGGRWYLASTQVTVAPTRVS